MLGYVMVGTNNLEEAIKFYDKVLDPLGLVRVDKDDVCAGYAQKNKTDTKKATVSSFDQFILK